MAFGLTNAPATFQHLMEHCMGELNLKECFICLDGIAILYCIPHMSCMYGLSEIKRFVLYCEYFDEHISWLGAVVG